MVGLSLLAYASESLQERVGEIDCDRVKTGIEGLSGNKGGLCVRFLLGPMSLCFANVHLPSGTGKADERNEHLNEARICGHRFDAWTCTVLHGVARCCTVLLANGCIPCLPCAGVVLRISRDFSKRLYATLQEWFSSSFCVHSCRARFDSRLWRLELAARRPPK